MSPVIRASEVSVVPQRIAHRNVEVSVRSPRAGVQALMNVTVRHSPQQPLDGDAVSLQPSTRQPIHGTDRDDVEVVASNLDIVDPGVIGKRIQQVPRLVPPGCIEVVDEQRLAATGKDASRRVEPHRQKRIVVRRIEPHDFQIGIEDAVVEVIGQQRGRGQHQQQSQTQRHAKFSKREPVGMPVVRY